ncbi:MAG: hypothetical protein AB7K24_14560 [Gemmataceae bacterium]
MFPRGERIAVCDKTFNLLQREPYAGMFLPVQPVEVVPLESAGDFDCRRSRRRHPRESKGSAYRVTSADAAPLCVGKNGCC